ILDGAALGAYAFTGYRTKPDPRPAPPTSIVPAGATGIDDAGSAAAHATPGSDHHTRALHHPPANHLYHETLAAKALAQVTAIAATGVRISARALDPAELAAEGYTGILAVGQGSIHPPRLVVVEYRPEGATQHVALVGKGI